MILFPRPAPLARRLPYVLAVLLTASTFSACSSSSDEDDPGSPAGPSNPPPANAPVHYTALGASDAAGVGSSAPCLPFTACPNGAGYVPRVARDLGAGGADVTLLNMGIPGAVLSPEVQQLGNSVGVGIESNMLQQQAPFVPRETTLVTMFAGGNDTNTIATAIDRGATNGADIDDYIDQQVRAFAADYVRLVEGVRQRAPNARIIVINLPNLAGLPYTAARPPAERQWIQRLSVGFAVQGANALVRENVAVIDLLCDPRAYQASNYSSDGFHPNDAGYAFLAAEVLQAVRAGGAPTPAASCPQMTLVPR